jgi:MscS family membrane protein
MKPYSLTLLFILSLFPAPLCSQAATTKPAADPLNRSNPRSAVIGFLQSCHSDNYTQAAQYLDLRHIPQRDRTREGPQLARQLEAILNSDSRFDVLRLSQAPVGNLSNDANPSLEQIATLQKSGVAFSIQLERTELQPGTQVWLFSPATVSAIPSMVPAVTQSAFEAKLPGFLVKTEFLETPIWKWIALIVLAALVLFLFRSTGNLLLLIIGKLSVHSATAARWRLIESVLQPLLVLLSAIAFGIAEQFIDPSALSRLYIGRAILLVVVWSFAWCVINLVDLFLTRIDSLLDPRQRVVSHSLLYIGRRAAKVAIFAIAGIIILDNWGYNMTTIIAGLGVGGIAVALAAQSTIANVFGGVSVIADRPVLVGDFGNFGGVVGNVEDIGMRSTRVRTLSRTIMSIPNNSFAGMNLENYAERDKILFNPTLQIKRGMPKDKLRELMTTLEEMLKTDRRLEIGNSPIRISGLTAASFSLDIFAYALTPDINEFYKIEADLFLEIDAALTSAGIELA